MEIKHTVNYLRVESRVWVEVEDEEDEYFVFYGDDFKGLLKKVEEGGLSEFILEDARSGLKVYVSLKEEKVVFEREDGLLKMEVSKEELLESKNRSRLFKRSP